MSSQCTLEITGTGQHTKEQRLPVSSPYKEVTVYFQTVFPLNISYLFTNTHHDLFINADFP